MVTPRVSPGRWATLPAPWVWPRLRGMPAYLAKACTRRFPVSGVPISTPSSRLSAHWG